MNADIINETMKYSVMGDIPTNSYITVDFREERVLVKNKESQRVQTENNMYEVISD